MENGQRRRDYIGNKANNVENALQRVIRYKRCQQLRQERARVRTNLREYIPRRIGLMSTEVGAPGKPRPTQARRPPERGRPTAGPGEPLDIHAQPRDAFRAPRCDCQPIRTASRGTLAAPGSLRLHVG